ncbi:hypothetical protein GQ600_20057 [Phytophthora cactorum]|nr:hypothetical protein GQ600_20057 [Phytophthora cactorum]
MMNLQAVLKAILDRFNLVDVAFEREQKRLENTRYRTDVVAFCSWVTSMIREFFMWEQAALQYRPEFQRLIWWSPEETRGRQVRQLTQSRLQAQQPQLRAELSTRRVELLPVVRAVLKMSIY